ncbi:sigma-70 family RNA polymerase sigma factor [Dactylosporangium sp. NPDC048998]|uniref:sigma-70 family RNA polymerase sigma factor n=1 Tax=Dactylosporangium sp. NPDC048998 TaxID=3363976 RepID=UPI00371F980E
MGTATRRVGDVRELYVTSYARLVRVLAVAAGDRAEAEDVVQEAFARLVPRWRVIADYDDPEAWVRKVAFRLLSKRARRMRHHLTHHQLDVGAASREPETGVDLERALRVLPLAQRQVVVLHHLLDLPVAAVAAELGVAEGTVKSRLSRARATLAALLGEEEPS